MDVRRKASGLLPVQADERSLLGTTTASGALRHRSVCGRAAGSGGIDLRQRLQLHLLLPFFIDLAIRTTILHLAAGGEGRDLLHGNGPLHRLRHLKAQRLHAAQSGVQQLDPLAGDRRAVALHQHLKPR